MRIGLSGLVLFLAAGCGDRGQTGVRLATAPTLVETGLVGALVEAFQAAHPGYAIELLPAPPGPVERARSGEADVLFTNAPTEEARLVAEGLAVDRRVVMYSEFVLLGPPEDPADVAGIMDIAEAFRLIAESGMRFVYQPDTPGGVRPDRAIWASVGVAPGEAEATEGGLTMAETIRLASQQRAYMLADLTSFLALASAVDLEIVSQGDPRLVDAYAVLRVARAGNERGARAFADWLISPAARRVIETLAQDPFGAPVFRSGPPPLR